MSAGDKPAWSATAAHLRAVVAGVVLAAVALIGPRIDMAILAAPFVAAATYGAMRRPRHVLGVHLRVDATTLAEGQATSARVIVTGDGEHGSILAVEVTADRWTQCNPAGAARVVIVNPPSSEVSIDVRPVRWGRHELRARDVTVTSPLGAFRTVTTPRSVVVTTLPLAEMFAATDALPRPAALVGLHRSRRQGEGSELAEVRAFRPGDRLRRINWPVSSRVGVLHVTAAWSDRDTEVVLLLDTEHDLGISDGVDGRASSLDVAVRAAAAIADHYVRAGDRVSLTDLGRASAACQRAADANICAACWTCSSPPCRVASVASIRSGYGGCAPDRWSSPSARCSGVRAWRRSSPSSGGATPSSSSTRSPTAPLPLMRRARGARWPGAFGCSNGRWRSTAWASSGYLSSSGVGAARSTRCCAM